MYALQVVVAEASNARLYRSGTEPGSLELIESLASPTARSHEQGLVSSRQGRVINRGLGHSVTFSPKHTAREVELDRFARRIARRIGALGSAAPQSHLVVIAGVRLLGLIRKHLSVASEKRLLATLAKDLFHIDRSALETTVAALLARKTERMTLRRGIGSTSQSIRVH
jgi:protein required for attachment to host cells